MSNYAKGADALQALQATSDTSDNKFSKFNSGTSYKVKVLGTADLVQFYSYGIYQKTHSFVAKNPSTKNERGLPIDNLTPWDMAYKYLYKEDEEYNSPNNAKAYQFRAKERYMLGFYDITEGDLIVVDLSKKQAQAVHPVIMANKDKLDSIVFTLSKSGSGTSTVVSLSVEENVANLAKMKAAGIDAETSITDKELENFTNAPKEFDTSRFDGVLFEADTDQMIINLDKAGFDVSKIGLEVPEIPEEDEKSTEESANDSTEYDF